MKFFKKLTAVLASVLMITALFSGCSSSKEGEITNTTMLIAYTEECAPFLYTDENGHLTGFEAELIEKTFDSFCGDFKTYEFIKVEEGYELNKDTAFTDENGNSFSAIAFCGGMHKNEGTANEDYAWSNNIIENNIITVVPGGSEIKSYRDISEKSIGVAGAVAAAALEKNAAVKNSLASVAEYASADKAFAALDAGEIDAVVIDDFSFFTFSGNEAYTALNGKLDTLEYGIAFAKSNDLSGGFNEAVKEQLDPAYDDGDTLTPLVKKYFGYNACAFELE